MDTKFANAHQKTLIVKHNNIKRSERENRDDSLVSRHLCEGLLQLLSDGLVLLLLGDELILQPVHLLLKFLNRLLCELSPSLRLLQLGAQSLDLLLVGLLPLVRLLLSHLERLEVVGDNPQLLLQLEDLGLTHVGALLRLLQLGLAGGQLLRNLIVVVVGGFSLLPGLLELLLQGGDPLLILISLALEHLLGTLRVVRGGGGLVELGHGGDHLLLGLLKVLLEPGHPPVQGSISSSVAES